MGEPLLHSHYHAPFKFVQKLTSLDVFRTPFVFKQRNYDPETRTLKKHEGEENDTVEKAVEGLAERIIAEDEERRAQDLVRVLSFSFHCP